jgi:hypothetical protein
MQNLRKKNTALRFASLLLIQSRVNSIGGH